MNIRRGFLALAAMILGVGFLGAFPQQAQAAVTCTSYHSLYPGESSVYPNDWTTSNPNGHMFVCGNVTHAAAQQVLKGPQGLPANQKSRLQTVGVTYFYFANKADSDSYMSSTAPYAGHPEFQAGAARCGNTGYIFNPIGRSVAIAVSVFDTCQLTTGPIPNPNLQAVTLHETGHAFDFSIAAVSPNQAVSPSQSKAYRMLFNSSTNTPTAASDLYFVDNGDKTHSAPTKCGMFDSVQETPLEFDLGTTANPSPVCTGTTVNPPFTSLSNSAIAKQQDPYFTNPSTADRYKELFAEQFNVHTARIGTPDPLPLIDRYASNFRCTYITIDYYSNILSPPTTSVLQRNNCPIPAAADWNQQ